MGLDVHAPSGGGRAVIKRCDRELNCVVSVGRIPMGRAAPRGRRSIPEVPRLRLDAHLTGVVGLVIELQGVENGRVTGVEEEAGHRQRRRDLLYIHTQVAADPAAQGLRLKVVCRPGLGAEGDRVAKCGATQEAQARDSRPGVQIDVEVVAREVAPQRVGLEPGISRCCKLVPEGLLRVVAGLRFA